MAVVNPFARPEVDLPPERVAELHARGDIQLIDVREPHERAAGHIPGSRHIELERLASGAASIDRDRPVVFQCRLGARSAMATQAFRAAGWDAWNLAGGIDAWVARGLPIAPEGGHVADH
jgi:rhodanese-related sulfurtransferase